jgi:hypothetical protein
MLWPEINRVCQTRPNGFIRADTHKTIAGQQNLKKWKEKLLQNT